MLTKNLERLPLFIVNIDNKSPGVACNAMKYIAENHQYLNFQTNTPMIMFTRDSKPPSKGTRREILGNIKCRNMNNNVYNFLTGFRWQRDEFPPSSVKDGYFGKMILKYQDYVSMVLIITLTVKI
ncbi:hypothetical protein G9O61_00g022640 [Vairimorpha ceranae]|nr:hypothetical protein G9O61_00g022640 [Vairimorpha ceranae]